MTTFELRDYGRQLEGAVEWFGMQDPVPPAWNRLQATLDAVIAGVRPPSSSRPARSARPMTSHPDNLPEMVFKALYPEFELRAVDGTYVVVPGRHLAAHG